MAGSRRGTADWHFATGHFGRKRAIRRRGGGAGGGGGAPAAGTGRVSGTAEEVRAEEERAEEEHRPLARGPVGDAGVPAAKRRGGSRKGKTPADGTGPADRAAEEELRLRAQGGSAEHQRSSSCGHKAGRRNGGGGAGGEGGAPAAGTGPVRGAGVPATKRSDGGRKEKLRPRARGPAGGTKKACAAAGPYPEVRTTYIIGSVRRGYALQRRESSCRPT